MRDTTPLLCPPPVLPTASRSTYNLVTLAAGEAIADINGYAPGPDSNGRDFVVQLPTRAGEYVLGGFAFHGRGNSGTPDTNGRHLVIIGGSIYVPFPNDTADQNYFATYTLEGSPTGGTWGTGVSSVLTDPTISGIPYNATASQLQTALCTAVGDTGACTVTGSAGGPWTLSIPPGHALIGRLEGRFTGTGLTGGSGYSLSRTNEIVPGSEALTFKYWDGIVHLEGVHIYGPGLNEGIDVAMPGAASGIGRLQIQNCRIEASDWGFHNDLHHPDGTQAYYGPQSLVMDRVDVKMYLANGQGLMGQINHTNGGYPDGTPACWYDYWFRDCFWDLYPSVWQPTTCTAMPLYKEDDWPVDPDNGMYKWQWRGTTSRPCYARRPDGSTFLYDHYPESNTRYPSWYNPNAAPTATSFCDPAYNECGNYYVSPGYFTTPPPYGTDHLAEALAANGGTPASYGSSADWTDDQFTSYTAGATIGVGASTSTTTGTYSGTGAYTGESGAPGGLATNSPISEIAPNLGGGSALSIAVLL